MVDDWMSDPILLSLGSQTAVEVVNHSLNHCNHCLEPLQSLHIGCVSVDLNLRPRFCLGTLMSLLVKIQSYQHMQRLENQTSLTISCYHLEIESSSTKYMQSSYCFQLAYGAFGRPAAANSLLFQVNFA